jgi:hypothetical protein
MTDIMKDKNEQKEKLTAAAYKLKNGDIVTGKTHMEAWEKITSEPGLLPFKQMSEEGAIKELINDCEIHYGIDQSIFSTQTNFYEFLYTEVKFHADSWGLDFAKAKDAYEYWAKKWHSVEYRRL